MVLKYREHFLINSKGKKEKWNYDSNLSPEIDRFIKDGIIDNKEANALKEILYFNNVKKHRELQVLKRTTKEQLEKLKTIPGVTKYIKFEINKILNYSKYKTLKDLAGLEKLIDTKDIRKEDLEKWLKKGYKRMRIWIDGEPSIVSISELRDFYNEYAKSKGLRQVIDRDLMKVKINLENVDDNKREKVIGTYINQEGKKEKIYLKKIIHPGVQGFIKEKVNYIVELDNSTGFFKSDLKKEFDHKPSRQEINDAVNELINKNKVLLEKKEVVKNIDIKRRAIKDILDYIAMAEGTKNKYNVRFGHRRVPNLSKMTLNQVIRFQHQVRRNYLYKKRRGLLPKKYRESTAIGRYQFMLDTLRGFKNRKDIKGTEKFTPQFQDKLAIIMLKNLGLEKFLSGKISLNQFLHRLSQKWASIPDPYKNWKSYHHKDGINKVTIGAKKGLKRFVRKMKKYVKMLKKA